MDEAQRWSVTYTNHVKQKRKVYHDGFLLIQSSRNKVMLYDEWDKLLETMFMKKDDLILSGETVTFGSYLVDLGELCQGHQPTSVLNSQDHDKKVSETSNSFYSYSSQNRKPMVGKRGRGLNISPSQKMIRDFKKSEMNKVGSSPSCMDMTKLSTKEWQVLYTAQITQKAKKYHDGFLQLIVCGSQGRQVKLYDTNRRHLDGRFLKRDEIVSSGELLVLDGHLVEIGEQEDHKPPTDSNVQGKSCTVAGKSGMVDYQAKIPINKKFTAGKTPGDNSQGTLTKLSDSSYQNENAKLSRGDAEPRRSVYDILSILKQPSERKDNPVNKSFARDCTESHSTDTKNHIKEYTEESRETARKEEHDSMIKVVKTEPVDKVMKDVEERAVPENGGVPHARSDTKNHIKECAEESRATARKEEHDSMIKVVKTEPVDKVMVDVEERAVPENGGVPQARSDTKNHIKEYAEESRATARKEERDSMIKVVKTEPVDKVIIDVEERAVPENGGVPQARSSSFQPRPKAVNFMSSTRNVQYTNLTKFKSSSSSVKSHAAVNSDIQKDKESESLTRSYKKQELENPSIIYSCEEAAATESNASSFCKLPEVQEGKKRSSSRGVSLNERILKKDLDKQYMDDYPSFDLGIL